MEKQIDSIEVTSFGQVFPKKGTNTRTPYSHQKNAMEALDKMNQESSFSTLVVLPTGGGKTYTASNAREIKHLVKDTFSLLAIRKICSDAEE